MLKVEEGKSQQRELNEKQAEKYFCLIGPSRSSAGLISASGLLVSTVVDTIAMNHPLAAT